MGLILALWAVAASAQSTTNYSFTFPVNEAVSDGNASGLALTTNLTGMSGTISNVTVSLDITGGYNGDLYVYLDGPNGGFAVLLNRAGVTGGNAFGYSDTGFNVTFNDSAGYNNIHFYQNSGFTLNGGGQLTGIWSSDGRAIDPLSAPSTFTNTQPTSLLDSFHGTDPNGTWKLFLSDLSNGEQSTLVNWRLDIGAVPEPSSLALFGIGAGIFLAARFGVCPHSRWLGWQLRALSKNRRRTVGKASSTGVGRGRGAKRVLIPADLRSCRNGGVTPKQRNQSEAIWFG